MNEYRDQSDNIRNLLETEPVAEFLATVVIPKGFVVKDANYNINLTINKQELSEVGVTQICRCGSSEDCTSTNQCVLLNGILTYNVTLEYFRAACLLDSDNLTRETAFSDYGNIYVNRLLVCRRGREPVQMPDYTIIPVQGEEFITCSSGHNIYRKDNKKEFSRLLENPDIEKNINIPYRIFVVLEC